MAYTNRPLVETFLQRDLTENEAAFLAVILPALKVWIDKRLNSCFDEVSATTRYYDGGVRSLTIEPCTAIAKVEAINDDGTDSYEYTDTYEFVTEPQNQTVKTEIRKRLAKFPRGTHRIAVTAKFSEYDNGVPADIQVLATRLAAGILNQGKVASQGGNILNESLEGHEIRYQMNTSTIEGIAVDDPTVSAILQQREELYVDTYDRRNEFGYSEGDDGGLMI